MEGWRVGVYRSRMCSWFSAMNVLTSSMYLARRALACAHAHARSRALACALRVLLFFQPKLDAVREVLQHLGDERERARACARVSK